MPWVASNLLARIPGDFDEAFCYTRVKRGKESAITSFEINVDPSGSSRSMKRRDVNGISNGLPDLSRSPNKNPVLTSCSQDGADC